MQMKLYAVGDIGDGKKSLWLGKPPALLGPCSSRREWGGGSHHVSEPLVRRTEHKRASILALRARPTQPNHLSRVIGSIHKDKVSCSHVPDLPDLPDLLDHIIVIRISSTKMPSPTKESTPTLSTTYL